VVEAGLMTIRFSGGSTKRSDIKLTRRANVIPASNAPKNTQNPMKKMQQSLSDFLW
jgi:hypothetical protein